MLLLPLNSVDGNWSDWNDWSECPVQSNNFFKILCCYRFPSIFLDHS